MSSSSSPKPIRKNELTIEQIQIRYTPVFLQMKLFMERMEIDFSMDIVEMMRAFIVVHLQKRIRNQLWSGGHLNHVKEYGDPGGKYAQDGPFWRSFFRLMTIDTKMLSKKEKDPNNAFSVFCRALHSNIKNIEERRDFSFFVLAHFRDRNLRTILEQFDIPKENTYVQVFEFLNAYPMTDEPPDWQKLLSVAGNREKIESVSLAVGFMKEKKPPKSNKKPKQDTHKWLWTQVNAPSYIKKEHAAAMQLLARFVPIGEWPSAFKKTFQCAPRPEMRRAVEQMNEPLTCSQWKFIFGMFDGTDETELDRILETFKADFPLESKIAVRLVLVLWDPNLQNMWHDLNISIPFRLRKQIPAYLSNHPSCDVEIIRNLASFLVSSTHA